MDLKKDQSHGILYQTTDTDTEKTYEPVVIGSWHLRNREQLKKRKDEAQKKQMLQWHLEDPKIHKRRRRSRNVNRKDLNKQQSSETNAEPLLPAEKEMQGAPAQGENSARYHTTAEMICFCETDQNLTGPEDSLLNTCQTSPGSEKVTFKHHAKAFQLEDILITLEAIPITEPHGPGEPDYILREISEETTVPTASYKVIEVTPKPEVSSLETHQEICGDEKCSPEAYQEMPGIEDLYKKRHQNSDEPSDCFLEEIQQTDTSEDQDTGTHQSVNT